MSRLSSKQRKIAYLIGIVILLIPIIGLGMPAGRASEGGGKLAQLRMEYDLGEPTMGDVDPTSAAMNLVLLGLRGLATDLLWLECDHLQRTKNWAQLRSTVDSIILLQPHFKRVWEFNSWNLAYNVSAEWDAVEDRYYWVKEGIKFLKKTKIGLADESSFYRKYFLVDPDTETFKGGPDHDVNPDEKDNYLAARDQYTVANQVESIYGQRARARIVFRQYPARCLLDYANVLQREGNFGEVTRNAWSDAFHGWTREFGQEVYKTRAGDIRLEMDDEAIEAAARDQNVRANDLRSAVDQYQRMVNYRYWRTRALSESEALTEEAHRDIYEGQRLFKEAKLSSARERLEAGMEKFAEVLKKHPTIASEDDAVDEALLALLHWRYILQLQQEPVPRDYALRTVWDQHQTRIPELDRQFKRENGLQ